MVSSVLVIDDQPTIQNLLNELLRSEGYETSIASDGAEGLRMMYDTRPDLVITDLFMPVMDGYEFVRSARQICNVPIMMLTGLGWGCADRSRLHQVDEYLEKPIEVDEFNSRVRALIARGSSKPTLRLITTNG